MADYSAQYGYIKGIPAEFFSADTHTFFYKLAYERGFLQRLRGSGPEAVVESALSAIENQGFTRLFTRRKRLDPYKVSSPGCLPAEDVRERPEDAATSVTGHMLRKVLHFEEKDVADIVSRYKNSVQNIEESIGKPELASLLQERFDNDLAESLTSRYHFTENGKMPLACRMVCGTVPDEPYVYHTADTLKNVIVKCIPHNASNGGYSNEVRQKYGMSVAHIRKLKRYATVNPYFAEKILPSSIKDSRLLTYSKYYLIMDSLAADSLRGDPAYKELHYTISRDLGWGQGSALYNAEYLGCIADIECYQVAELDTLRGYKKRCPGLDAVEKESSLSWSFLIGAGALGEVLGNTRYWQVPDVHHNYETGVQFIHGAGSLCFGISRTRLREYINAAGANQLATTFYAAHPDNEYMKIEQGILHSITLNEQVDNWGGFA